MRELEYAATMASLFGPADFEYPKEVSESLDSMTALR